MRSRITRQTIRLAALRLLLVAVACVPASDAQVVPRSTLFVGVDVSGSFKNTGRYDDAMAFAARYIHAHMNGLGGLEQPRALFVGAIGGEEPGEPQAFHPIHDFEGKTPEQIERDLRAWFPPVHDFTDFDAFFRRAATLVKRQNLALAPVSLVLLTDGVPDLGPKPPADDPAQRYRAIDLDPLEYLARNVTLRLLYPDPAVAVRWERDVPRERVRMWTVDAVVMDGWRAQMAAEPRPEPAVAAGASTEPAVEAPPQGDSASVAPAVAAATAGEQGGDPVDGTGPGNQAAPAATGRVVTHPIEQPLLWRWIQDNVDYRVRRTML